jgi:DNA-binding NarL/FixJ family response regulator
MITTVAIITRLRLFQELLASLVGSRPGFAVIAVSTTEREATRAIIAQHPDVALIDAAIPGVWNIVKAADEGGIRAIVFGVIDEDHPIGLAQRSGCAHVLVTTATSHALIDALEEMRLVETRPHEHPLEAQIVGNLTSREFEVLGLVARGLSNKEIATVLTVSVPTVKTHVHNVLHKLGTRRRLDAGRLLHVAACDASVDPQPLRPLGVVSTPRAIARARRPEQLHPIP